MTNKRARNAQPRARRQHAQPPAQEPDPYNGSLLCSCGRPNRHWHCKRECGMTVCAECEARHVCDDERVDPEERVWPVRAINSVDDLLRMLSAHADTRLSAV